MEDRIDLVENIEMEDEIDLIENKEIKGQIDQAKLPKCGPSLENQIPSLTEKDEVDRIDLIDSKDETM